MLIVDSQVHIWGANTPERPWPTPKDGLKPVPVHNNGVPFTQDFVVREMQAAGVYRVIIVPPSWEGDHNDLALDSYPYRSLHPYLRRVYEAYGLQRLFWGTDLSRLPCTYRQGVTMFTEEIPWLTDEDREWIMGRGVCEWLGWNTPR